MKQAVLFDLDGTLVDSLADLAAAVNDGLVRLGFAAHPVEAFRDFVGSGVHVMLRRALPPDAGQEWVDALHRHFFDYYGVHFADHSAPYAGMPQTLAALRAQGILLGVVTNKAERMASTVLARLYGPDCFQVICAQCDDRPAKPDPTMARLALAELGVDAADCLFVGDSGIDMQTARNSGTTPVGVTWGYRPVDELRAAGARYLIDAPAQLPPLLALPD